MVGEPLEEAKLPSVIMIEDDPHLVFALQEALAGDYQIVSVSKIADARYRLSLQRYCCIVIDLHLSKGGNGLDLIPYIRDAKESMNKDSPILLISGALNTHIIRSMASKINGAMVKPFSTLAFQEKLSALCKTQRTKLKTK